MDPDGRGADRRRVRQGMRRDLPFHLAATAAPAVGITPAAPYAGWGAGQLDAELAASSWLHADIDLDIVFDTRAADMWEATIRSMGADPSFLQQGGTGAVH